MANFKHERQILKNILRMKIIVEVGGENSVAEQR